jgi:pSer/pThr/pTyr-binding forkhead associated (FHA) protein
LCFGFPLFITVFDTIESREAPEAATQPEVDIQTQPDNTLTNENIVFLNASSGTVIYTLSENATFVLRNEIYIYVRRPERNGRLGQEEEKSSEAHAASRSGEGERVTSEIPADLCK